MLGRYLKKIISNEALTEHLLIFEENILHTMEHGVESAKSKFLHKMRQRDLILMNSEDEWKSDEKL